MSGQDAPVLRHIDLPIRRGTRLSVWAPRGHKMTDVTVRPLTEGDGFTIDLDGFIVGLAAGRWRAVLKSLTADRDGTALELEVEGRYPEDEQVSTVSAPPPSSPTS